MEAPRLNAEVLLAYALHQRREYFFAHPEQELKPVEWLHFGRYLFERQKGRPTQYITGRQEFYGREFRVNGHVLIPRPETEHLVEAVLGKAPPEARILDVGCGSGAIAVTVALELAAARVAAVDISSEALQVARGNADALGAKVDFFQADLLTAAADHAFDVIASNPPYVAGEDQATLQREVRDWEPHVALFGGTDGLDVIRRLLPEAVRVLRPGGVLAMEIGDGQWDRVFPAAKLHFRNVEAVRDLAGIIRVVVAS